jgi:AcrR family transcriptional regulator
MARPVSIDEESLLLAAREVFLAKGISATTADIAERAGVSEGILFHRYGSKQALFSAAMRPNPDGFFEKLNLAERVGQGELEASLSEIALALVAFLRGVMPCIMMAWSNRGESGLPSNLEAPNPPPIRVIRELARYFEAEIRAGRMRRVDPEIMARAFVGGLMQYVFIETLGAVHGELPLPAEMYVRGLVDVLMKGIVETPDAVATTQRGRAKRATPRGPEKRR